MFSCLFHHERYYTLNFVILSYENVDLIYIRKSLISLGWGVSAPLENEKKGIGQLLAVQITSSHILNVKVLYYIPNLRLKYY